MKKDRFGSARFRLKAGLRTFRFWLWLIRFIGVIVPQRFRTRWRREWEAELEYRELIGAGRIILEAFRIVRKMSSPFNSGDGPLEFGHLANMVLCNLELPCQSAWVPV